MKFKILLNTFDKVKTFTDKVGKYDMDVDLISGRYIIDAKSIMGIFSLNLCIPIEITFHTEEYANKSTLETAIMDDFREYIYTEKGRK